jgi:hypothetical protein
MTCFGSNQLGHCKHEGTSNNKRPPARQQNLAALRMELGKPPLRMEGGLPPKSTGFLCDIFSRTPPHKSV